jgi:hypothetical protein
MEHTKHIIRAVLLVVFVGVVFVFVRYFSIPESFGAYGHYRADSVGEHARIEPIHGRTGACAACHEDEAEVLSEGTHRTISCEVCHAPLGNHVTGQEYTSPMPVQRSYQLCAFCHQKLAARPREFPQVIIPDHGVEKGASLSEEFCTECHDVHNPSE